MSNDRTKLVAWVYLDAGYTLRWRRGDRRAYVFRGRQIVNAESDVDAIDTVPVPTSGWVDLAHVRQVAHAWLDTMTPRSTPPLTDRRRLTPTRKRGAASPSR